MYRMDPKEEYDQFIVGVAQTQSGPSLIYDKDALLEHLAAQMSELADDIDEYNAWDLAAEHFEYNIYGSTEYMGAGAPLFVSRMDWEIAQEDESAGSQSAEAGSQSTEADPQSTEAEERD